MKVVFRVDASLQMGTGHVVRCLTFADRLRALGATCLFVCRAHSGNMIAVIRQQGFEVAELPAVPEYSLAARETGDALPAHFAWLNCDWRSDAEQTLRVVQSVKPDMLVVDHYAVDFRWEAVLRPFVRRIMVVDDLADRKHACDCLLDQNWFGEDMLGRYRGLIPDHCVTMLGPGYALLRPEYAALRALMAPRDGEVRRVLVFMGGSDPTDETGKVLDALARPDLAHLTVDVVIGVNHPDFQGIARKASLRPATHVYSGLPSLADWMVRADLMISAGGSISWERMCLGLPAIVVTVADNQVETSLSLMRARYIDLIGSKEEVDREMIADAIQRNLANSSVLRQMSIRSQELVSGTGVEAVCKHLGLTGA